MVRAKFRVTKSKDGQIVAEAVIDGSEENKQFFQFTPSGSLSLGTVNPHAAAYFEEGAEYYLDFTRAGSGG